MRERTGEEEGQGPVLLISGKDEDGRMWSICAVALLQNQKG